MKLILEKLIAGSSLTTDEAAGAMTTILDGAATPAQIAALLMCLRIKGETVDEITGLARVMREKAVRVHTKRTPLVDMCGTGGDTLKTFNISTTAAFIVAAAGGVVAKHGNRSVTSKSGSADVLEELGVRLDLTPEQVAGCIDEIGIGFMFARAHHPAMKHAAPVRAELGVRTVFNALGPLTNPAGATRQVIGVYDGNLCQPLAQVLGNLGAEHVLVVHGEAGLDEIATFGPTRVAEYKDGVVWDYTITAATLGLPEADPNDLLGSTEVTENAAILAAILHNNDTGPRRDIVLANAAAALYVAGVVPSLASGVAKAQEALTSYAAMGKLDALVTRTNELAGSEA